MSHTTSLVTRSRYKATEQPMRMIDFSHDGAAMQVSTCLRRACLLDPKLLPSNETQNASGSAPGELEQLFRNTMKHVGTWIAQTSKKERWDDDIWKTRTEFAFLDPPIASIASDGGDDDAQASIFTPFRRAIYGAYDHVFWDSYNALKNETDFEIGEFKPPNTTIMVLNFPRDGTSKVHHPFITDTFMYPVWIAPNTTLTLAVSGSDCETTLVQKAIPGHRLCVLRNSRDRKVKRVLKDSLLF
jgi:hypothetical protein